MTRYRTSACPNLESMLRLEIFEERAVPAHIGAPAPTDVDQGHGGDNWATVESSALHKADTRLKSWLSEDSLYVDGPDHSDRDAGQGKSAARAELNNSGSLAKLDSTLANFISYFFKWKDGAKEDTSDPYTKHEFYHEELPQAGEDDEPADVSTPPVNRPPERGGERRPLGSKPGAAAPDDSASDDTGARPVPAATP